jgi:hypothetical protein
VRGADPPALDCAVPAQGADHGAEQRRLVEVEVLPDPSAIVVDFRAVGIAILWDVVELFEQGKVGIGFVIALDARIAVPVPDAAEVSAHFDDSEIPDTGLRQMSAGEQTREAAAEYSDVDVL